MQGHNPPLPTPQNFIWMERGTAKVKCFAKEHNKLIQQGLETSPLQPESSALTIRPLGLPL